MLLAGMHSCNFNVVCFFACFYFSRYVKMTDEVTKTVEMYWIYFSLQCCHMELCISQNCVFHGSVYATVLCISCFCVSHCTVYFMELCIPQYCLFHGSVYPTVLCISWFCVSYGTVYFIVLCIPWYCVFHGTLYPMVLCISWYCVFHGSVYPTSMYHICVSHHFSSYVLYVLILINSQHIAGNLETCVIH